MVKEIPLPRSKIFVSSVLDHTLDLILPKISSLKNLLFKKCTLLICYTHPILTNPDYLSLFVSVHEPQDSKSDELNLEIKNI